MPSRHRWEVEDLPILNLGARRVGNVNTMAAVFRERDSVLIVGVHRSLSKCVLKITPPTGVRTLRKTKKDFSENR
jgi:hypothetical protein